MTFDVRDGKPIYLQLSEYLEGAVLSGAFPEETQLPSTTELSVLYKINPATALKGINILVEEEIAYKKRGLGIFVRKGAVDMLKKKRKREFFDNYVAAMLREAQNLGIDTEELVNMIRKGTTV